jgi:8-oxo-dGTP diphosphatase
MKMLHAADGILKNNKNMIILIQRASETFKGYWALPGGIVEKNESVEETLIREMREEVGVQVKPLEILGIFSNPNRDPRGRVITTVFICDYDGKLKAGSDAGKIKLSSLDEALKLNLAFDHHDILKCYKNWLIEKGTYWSQKSQELP